MTNRFENLVNKVKYKDDDMTERSHDSKPVNLGFDGMSKNMERILSNPTNHSVYRKIKEDNIKVSMEECFAKLGWSTLDEEMPLMMIKYMMLKQRHQILTI